MRETRSSGSVGGEGATSPPTRRGISRCPRGWSSTAEFDPKRAWAKCGGVSEIATTLRPWGYSIGSSARGGNASRVKPIALMTFGSTTRLNLLELNRQVARPCCRAGCG